MSISLEQQQLHYLKRTQASTSLLIAALHVQALIHGPNFLQDTFQPTEPLLAQTVELAFLLSAEQQMGAMALANSIMVRNSPSFMATAAR